MCADRSAAAVAPMKSIAPEPVMRFPGRRNPLRTVSAALQVIAAGVSLVAATGVRASVPAHGAPPALPPFGIEHLISLRSMSELTWSPDGRRLAFVVADPD